LRSFVVLADELHFGRAAARIHLTQPSLSHQIKQLEREVGARLFDRASSGVRLTQAGELFLPHARATLRTADRAMTAVREQVSGVTGRLRVGVFAHGAAELTVPILRAFRAARPGVQITVRELDFTQQTTEVADHRVDLAFVRPPLADDRVMLTPLAMEPRVAVLPSTHPLAGAASVMVEDLLDDPVIASHPLEPRVWTDYWRMADRRGGIAPRVVGPDDVRTVVELLHAVILRDCVTTTAASLSRYYPFPGVAYVPVADLEGCEIAIATRQGEADPLVSFFVSTARHLARRLPELVLGGPVRR
jgi:DNA-binding transcriptional LysR family regulator